jgi:multicomponent K+:H+ antiporter subunit F
MIDYALGFAFLCFGAGLGLNLWRVVVSQSVPDRVLALDTMVINVIALIVLYGIATGSALYFEASLMFAMTGFVSTIAYARFMLRGDVIE